MAAKKVKCSVCGKMFVRDAKSKQLQISLLVSPILLIKPVCNDCVRLGKKR